MPRYYAASKRTDLPGNAAKLVTGTIDVAARPVCAHTPVAARLPRGTLRVQRRVLIESDRFGGNIVRIAHIRRGVGPGIDRPANRAL